MIWHFAILGWCIGIAVIHQIATGYSSGIIIVLLFVFVLSFLILVLLFAQNFQLLLKNIYLNFSVFFTSGIDASLDIIFFHFWCIFFVSFIICDIIIYQTFFTNHIDASLDIRTSKICLKLTEDQIRVGWATLVKNFKFISI